MQSRNRTRLLSGAILAVVFVAGALLGMALDVRLDARPADDAVAEGDAAEAGDRRDDDERRGRRVPMYRQVGDLTEAQEVEIRELVDAHRDSLKALHREFRDAWDPKYWAIVQGTRDAIRGVMTPEQAERYDSLLAEHDSRRDRRDDEGRRDP